MTELVEGLCTGDSGGPIQKLIDDRWYEVGVISKVACGNGGDGMAIKVASLKDWIVQTVDEKCDVDWNCGCD